MLREPPYFMENEEWYYHDKEKMKYFLTDKAPKEAVESYKQYYNRIDYSDMIYIINRRKKALKDKGYSESEIKRIIDEELKELDED